MFKWIFRLFSRSPRQPDKIPGRPTTEEIEQLVGQAATLVSLRGKIYVGHWEEIDCKNDIMTEFMRINPYATLTKKDLCRAANLCKKLAPYVVLGRLI